MDQRALGFFVFLTATFAFISGYYALLSVFGDWDPIKAEYHLSQKMSVITIGVAILYALMIGMIDREIVSANSKWAVLLRIPLAIIIGVVIAVPLKLKILEDRIYQKIEQNQASQMAPYFERKNAVIASIDKEVSDLEMQIAYYVNQLNKARDRIRDEDLGLAGAGLTGLPGQGKFYRYARQEQTSYEEEIARLTALKAEKLAYRAQRLNELESDLQVSRTAPVYGLWEKYLVMQQVVEEDQTGKARLMVTGLSILFILFELIPSLIKLWNPKNDYDKLLDFVNALIDRKLDVCLEEFSSDFEFDELLQIPEIRTESQAEQESYRRSA